MKPFELMRGAALDAWERVDDVFWQRDPNTFFAPLADTLVWMTALADAMGKLHEPEHSGLAYARNCTLHGFKVVGAIFVQQPGEPSPLKGDHARMVFQGPATIWGFTADPEPYDPTSGVKETNRQRRADYNAYIAEHALFTMLPRLLIDLGVNIYAIPDDRGGPGGLTPRRPPRRVSIPPGYIPQVDGPLDREVEQRVLERLARQRAERARLKGEPPPPES